MESHGHPLPSQAIQGQQDLQGLRVFQELNPIQEQLDIQGLLASLGLKASQDKTPIQVLQVLQARGETLAQLEAKVLKALKAHPPMSPPSSQEGASLEQGSSSMTLGARTTSSPLNRLEWISG